MVANYEKYVKIRDRKGMKDSAVAKIAGIPQPVFSEWKKGKAKPKADKIYKIASALKVSYFELVDFEPEEAMQNEMLAIQWDFSEDELSLVKRSRYLNEEGFDKLSGYLDDLLGNDKYMN